MDLQGYFIVFGSLALCVGAIIAGSIWNATPAGVIACILGGFGLLAWIGTAFYILNAMNTDI